jgi:hypothetical protein
VAFIADDTEKNKQDKESESWLSKHNLAINTDKTKGILLKIKVALHHVSASYHIKRYGNYT